MSKFLPAEMDERQAKLEGYDVESVLGFAEHIILNASRLWLEASSDQKERLQKVLFPRGVDLPTKLSNRKNLPAI